MWAQRAVCLLLVCVTCSARPGWAYPPSRVIVVPADSESRPIVLTAAETRLLLSGPEETTVAQSNSMHQPGDQTFFVHKRACNTATCATQRLMDYLSRARGMEGAGPTDTGAGTFGRRRR